MLNKGKKILVTGVAGFIGSKTAEILLSQGAKVVGVDNLCDAYDIRLKKYRLSRLSGTPGFKFHRADVSDASRIAPLFRSFRPQAVINLAARAGVRYSIENPRVYLEANTLGTMNLLELCHKYGTKKFVLSSTSSLYASEPMPFRESQPVNTPISPYAATKKAAEAFCYTYHHLYGIDVTVFRYFTVYGPAGRPDMSYFKFIRNIQEGRPIVVYGDGRQSRDFTYIDDIAEGTVLGLRQVGYGVFNLGGQERHRLNEMITLIEKCLGRRAKIKYLPSHPADMRDTQADNRLARTRLGWKPRVKFETGIRNTVKWFLENESLVRRLRVES